MGGAAAQQAVGEAAGRRADVDGDQAVDVESEGGQRAGQLLAAAAHVLRPGDDLDRRSIGYERPGLRDRLPFDKNGARHNQSARLLPAFGQSALDDKKIETALSRHVRKG